MSDALAVQASSCRPTPFPILRSRTAPYFVPRAPQRPHRRGDRAAASEASSATLNGMRARPLLLPDSERKAHRAVHSGREKHIHSAASTNLLNCTFCGFSLD